MLVGEQSAFRKRQKIKEKNNTRARLRELENVLRFSCVLFPSVLSLKIGRTDNPVLSKTVRSREILQAIMLSLKSRRQYYAWWLTENNQCSSGSPRINNFICGTRKNKRAARAARTLEQSRAVLCKTTTCNSHSFGFYDNLSKYSKYLISYYFFQGAHYGPVETYFFNTARHDTRRQRGKWKSLLLL